jgi:hypothetical protein
MISTGYAQDLYSSLLGGIVDDNQIPSTMDCKRALLQAQGLQEYKNRFPSNIGRPFIKYDSNENPIMNEKLLLLIDE